MRSVWMLLRAESRRRWASWVALAFLISLIGGTVLAGVSTAQRTSSAFPQFLDKYGYNAEVFGLEAFPKGFDHLPHVLAFAESSYIFNGNALANGHFIPAGDINVLSLPTTRRESTIRLLSGRMPIGPHEVLAGYSMQQQFGLTLGSVVSVPFYKPSQRHEVISSNNAPIPHGPTVHFRVVGFETSVIDFPTFTPTYSLYTSPAFSRGEGKDVVSGYFAQVRLAGGEDTMPRFQYEINNFAKHGEFFAQDEDTSSAAIEGSIHPQAVGWWLFALFAALVGIALIGQALSRQSLVEKESYSTLAALGIRPNQLFVLGVLRAGLIGILGAVGALVLSYLVSPLTPVGEARAATLVHGLYFDVRTFVPGAILILVAVLILSIIPSWRAAQVGGTKNRLDQTVTKGRGNVADLLATLGTPPSVLIGVRNALERGRGRSSVPVATALIGTVLAVAALVASSVFGASLSNLLATPHLYGANWQVDLEGVPTANLHTILTTLKRDPAVDKITYGNEGKYVTFNGVSVQTVYVNVAKGAMVYSLIGGHYPTRAGQMDLGETTLAQTHTHIGSKVSVSVVNLKGATQSGEFTVVGTVAIPPSVGIGGLGDGAVVLIHGLEVLACGHGAAAVACEHAITAKIATNTWDVALGVAPGPSSRATIAHLDRRYAPYLDVQTRPTDLVNFGEAVDFPLLLGVTLTLFGAATLAHLLFVSVSRRRRQFALLKVLGFYRRQVRSSLCWQAATVAVIGVVFGVPLGIVAGKLVWRVFAVNLGAVPDSVVPVMTVLIVVGAIVVGSLVLALVPAALAARIQPAEALRSG